MGLTHVTAVVRNPADPEQSWEGTFLVDTGAIDCLVPGNYLREIAQAEQTREPGVFQEQALINLMQWVPRVVRACEHAETPASQLKHYLLEVNEALNELREVLRRMAAA